MSRQRRPDFPSSRNWEQLFENEDIDLVAVLHVAACSVAAKTAQDSASIPSDDEDEPDDYEIDISDPEDLAHEVKNGNKPPWWPKKLHRLKIRIRAQPDGETADVYNPSTHIDINRDDLGEGAFLSVLKNVGNSIGIPFSGTLKIEILDASDGKWVGGWKGPIGVGERLDRDGGGGRGGAESDYLWSKIKEQQDINAKIYLGAAANLHAAASVIQATRGNNMVPSWMSEDGDQPLWQKMVETAASVLGPALLGGQANPQAIGGLMKHPVQPGQPSPPNHHQWNHPLPGAVQPALPDYGGSTAGYRDREGYEPLEDDVYLGPDNMLDDDGYEYEDDDEDDYDSYEEAETPHVLDVPPPFGGQHNKSPEEFAADLEAYIDANPDKLGQIRSLVSPGSRLFNKLMK